MKTRILRNPHLWTVLLFAAGIVYLFSLQLLVEDGAYFSGDSGLRALISQNLAGGHLAFDMNLPSPPWVTKLWQQGLFPYEKPFVYSIGDRFYTTFPFTFPLVSAPFAALFGERGLYVLPWLATVVIWLVYLRLAWKLGISPQTTAVGLVLLIFASNLSLYSAIFWEHTLSVALAFGGLSLVIPARGAKTISGQAAVGAGVLTSLAVWLRPEQIFLVLLLGLLGLWSYAWTSRVGGFVRRGWLERVPDLFGRTGMAYILASLATLLLYGGLNWLIYHNFFGQHAVQVLERIPLQTRAATALVNLREMTIGSYSFFSHTPAALLPAVILLAALLWRARAKPLPGWLLGYGFCLAFIVGVAILVPPSAGGKQWGPRFLLLLVPISVLVITWQLETLRENRAKIPTLFYRAVWGLVIVLTLAGIGQNPLRGRAFLIRTYAPIQAVVRDLRADPPAVVGVSSPYLTQVFQPPVAKQAIFLRVSSEEQLVLFSQALLEQNQPDFRYLCYSFDCPLFDPAVERKALDLGGQAYQLETVRFQEYDRYRVFTLRLKPDEAAR